MHLGTALLISHGRTQRRFGLGPRSRLDLLRNLVTGLVRHERIEAPRARADEMRAYAEHLIDVAKRGDADPKAMRIADFWLTEKDLIHKLFRVLAPRFQAHQGNYTRLFRLPNRENLDRAPMAVVELKGNPLPPLPVPRRDGQGTLANQLLQGLRQQQQQQQKTAGGGAGTPQGTPV
ncbi:39S ribosomal protein L17, mitochondrial [Sceloporus undulatus]|uniref:39S ribosomal protein L17, mitochondrial n=1 Tax=Sceloporus undulatus TaxID=8520 RepID=UPI001C4D256A|nr:39S ribosomal protein L17, mitochondrial [Sceloporus undulatus]